MCKIREKQTVDFVTVSAAAFAGVVLSTSLAGKKRKFRPNALGFYEGKKEGISLEESEGCREADVATKTRRNAGTQRRRVTQGTHENASGCFVFFILC